MHFVFKGSHQPFGDMQRQELTHNVSCVLESLVCDLDNGF